MVKGWFCVCFLLVLCFEPVVANPTRGLPVPHNPAFDAVVVTTELLDGTSVTLLVDIMSRLCDLMQSDHCSVIKHPTVKASIPILVGNIGKVLWGEDSDSMRLLPVLVKAWRVVRTVSPQQAQCISTGISQLTDNVKMNITSSSWNQLSSSDIPASLRRLSQSCLPPPYSPVPTTRVTNTQTTHTTQPVSLLQLDSSYNVEKGEYGEDTLLQMGISPNTLKVLKIILIVVLVSSAVALIMAQHYWGIRAAGYENSFQTKVNVTSRWIEFISVISAIILFLVTHGIASYYRRQQATRFHGASDSVISLDDAYDTLESYIKAHSVSSFLHAMRSEQEMLLSPGSHSNHKMTLKEWSDPQRDADRPDPLRILIKFFYVTERDRNTFLSEGDTDGSLIVNDKRLLLSLAFKFRSLANQEAELLDEIVVDDSEAARLDEQDVEAEINDVVKELTSRLHSTWRNAYRLWAQKDSESGLVDMYDTADSWGGIVLAFGLLLGAAHDFLDLSPECMSLVAADGTLQQGMKRLSADDDYASPTIYFGDSWQCTHDPSMNIEEGGVCMLKCSAGFSPVKAVTVCDALGGGGIAWTHLNAGVSAGGKGDRSLDLPSCCPMGEQASVVNSFSVQVTNNIPSMTWTEDVAFSHACGVEQSVISQKCVVNTNSLSDIVTPTGYCSMVCDLAIESHSGCETIKDDSIVPTAEWLGIDLGHTKVDNYKSQILDRCQVEYATGSPLTPTSTQTFSALPSTSGTEVFFRVGVKNSLGTTFGAWVKHQS